MATCSDNNSETDLKSTSSGTDTFLSFSTKHNTSSPRKSGQQLKDFDKSSKNTVELSSEEIISKERYDSVMEENLRMKKRLKHMDGIGLSFLKLNTTF